MNGAALADALRIPALDWRGEPHGLATMSAHEQAIYRMEPKTETHNLLP
jgi:hypothetical protein